ncbi:MAG: ABC transporter permease [Candidatus Heimdallarchaeaceae archaeon]
MSKFKQFFMMVLTNIRATARNKMGFFFVIIFPLIFIGVFGLAWQTGDPQTSTNAIGVINYDQGIPEGVIAFWNDTSMVNGTFYSEEYIRILDNILYPDSEVEIFKVYVFNASNAFKAQTAVENRNIAALVTLHENFSLGVLSAFRQKFENDPLLTSATNNWAGYPPSNFSTIVTIDGDRSLQDFTASASIIEQVTHIFFNLGEDKEPVEILIRGSLDTSGFTIFDYIFPGLVVYGIFQTLGTVTDTAFGDITIGTLKRIKLCRISPTLYLSALVTSQMIISIIQIPIMFATGVLFGFPFSLQILYAFIIAIILALSSSGIGLIVAGLVNDATAGRGLAGIAATPIAFLSGAFFIVPNPTIIPPSAFLGGNAFKLFDVLPTTPAIRILRSILLFGNSLGDTLYDFIVLLLFTIIYLVIGVSLYTRKHFKTK